MRFAARVQHGREGFIHPFTDNAPIIEFYCGYPDESISVTCTLDEAEKLAAQILKTVEAVRAKDDTNAQRG